MWPRRKKEHDSEIALAEAQEHLERIMDRSVEVNKVAEASRKLLTRNHFVERLEQIMGG